MPRRAAPAPTSVSTRAPARARPRTRKTKEPVKIWPADDAEVLAATLIIEHHTEIADATISYLFTNQRATRGGRALISRTIKPTPLARYWTGGGSIPEGADFVLVFNADEWANLTDAGKRGAVDHALSRCGVAKEEEDGETRYRLVAPDVEEFAAVVQRNGLYHPGIERFTRTLAQGRFDLDAAGMVVR